MCDRGIVLVNGIGISISLLFLLFIIQLPTLLELPSWRHIINITFSLYFQFLFKSHWLLMDWSCDPGRCILVGQWDPLGVPHLWQPKLFINPRAATDFIISFIRSYQGNKYSCSIHCVRATYDHMIRMLSLCTYMVLICCRKIAWF